MDVFVAGGCSYDTIVYLEEFPRSPGTRTARGFQETVGSTGVGKSLNLGRLGVDVTFHGLVGDDRYGEAIAETFVDEPVTFLSDGDPNGTERHVNLMDADGERISIFVVEPTPDPDIDYDRLEDQVARSDVAIVNPVDYTRPLLAAAERHDTPVWCDVHDYDGEDPHFDEFVAAADRLFLSDAGLADPREFMREQVAAGTDLVVCTRGGDGSIAHTGDGEWVEVPAGEFEVVDTNGAGDAYVAGFCYGHAQGESVETCMRLGTLAGGLAVESWDLANPALSPDRLAAAFDRRYDDG
ncbi:carbohydrate kinase family protein [Haloarchaeobius amylolyticus]|uniref:carbohydrate kinase family protein n=1 Tax=Haloarchaeobius amylolyticus TaxID=1198296 RepID=UPI002271E180|nr:carbohydrate kinase family protein [Haloarchaeobius amylolyticus]